MDGQIVRSNHFLSSNSQILKSAIMLLQKSKVGFCGQFLVVLSLQIAIGCDFSPKNGHENSSDVIKGAPEKSEQLADVAKERLLSGARSEQLTSAMTIHGLGDVGKSCLIEIHSSSSNAFVKWLTGSFYVNSEQIDSSYVVAKSIEFIERNRIAKDKSEFSSGGHSSTFADVEATMVEHMILTRAISSLCNCKDLKPEHQVKLLLCELVLDFGHVRSSAMYLPNRCPLQQHISKTIPFEQENYIPAHIQNRRKSLFADSLYSLYQVDEELLLDTIEILVADQQEYLSSMKAETKSEQEYAISHLKNQCRVIIDRLEKWEFHDEKQVGRCLAIASNIVNN